MRQPAFIVLVEEETNLYHVQPCTVIVCYGKYTAGPSTAVHRAVTLGDGALLEDVEALRIFHDESSAEHWAARLNEMKTRVATNNEWMNLELAMKQDCFHAYEGAR